MRQRSRYSHNTFDRLRDAVGAVHIILAPRTPGEMGLRDVQLMELIYEAAWAGRPVPAAA